MKHRLHRRAAGLPVAFDAVAEGFDDRLVLLDMIQPSRIDSSTSPPKGTDR